MSKTTTKQVLAEHQAAADWENEGPDPLEEQQEQQDETDFANAKAGAQSRELAPTMPTVDDAWAAEANAPDRLLRGNLLKYVDRVWSCGRDDKPMRKGVQLFAAGVATAWQRWAGRKPVEA